MYQAIPYNPNDEAIFIDVRSESEFKNGHIVDAINLPILYDLERHEVGWIYKNASVEEAKRLGLKYGSEKLHIFYDTLFELKKKYPCKKIIFYCARGGYRSRSIALLMRSIDIPVYWIQGGYKAYRTEVLKKLNQPFDDYPNFIVLNGLTGVGKTHVLEELIKLDQPVIDLEAAANHKGSHLGAIGTDGFQCVQMFENNLYHQLNKIHQSYCFIESESRRIGKVFVPKMMFQKMQEGKFLLLKASMDFRVRELLKDYTADEAFTLQLDVAIEKLKPYLSNEHMIELTDLIASRDYNTFTKRILEVHYDPIYRKSITSHTHLSEFDVLNYESTAKEVCYWLASQE